ncbi:type VI secretion system ImpA family N-terminal domain-containing protein [Proteus cibi]|uniref:Type VI secretion system ImpA family N-terminal domain-containing protein n=1 Tax=Proteus cibi TaxID=2050966 RepID=A0ABU6EHI5_9GAMM|nr:VasL domain-containing protein [Proteus cibi]MEB6858537.1 type VI secretion system ImpA family N-terminal domain-containing protein [Proteus cibi]MEB7090040.1 type VI secretion system ImpA family N-terminal domain-containing protein [Proteus cibi]
MNTPNEKFVIKIAGSPLDIPEFIALKAEFNKLNHPSQPEISWTLIGSLSLTLFKTHGIDLQSGTYYTLARLHLDGLNGFTEGCELLANIVVSQWDNLWPTQPNHRYEVLNWFNTKASALLRQLTFSPVDLRLIYRSERALQLIINQLAHTDWPKLPKLENLLWFFQNVAKTLEQNTKNSTQNSSNNTIKIPPIVYISASDKPKENNISNPITEVILSNDPPIEKKPMSAKKGFFIGLLSSSTIFITIGTVLYLPMQKELSAITAQPEGAITQWLYQPNISSYANNLVLMEKQSPIFTLRRSEQMLDVAKKLWPNNADQSYATRQWQNILTTRLENAPIDSSWSDTNKLIQQLSDRIVQQERNRGSFTLSYLKTAIYEIQKSHNKSIPIENKLYAFSQEINKEQSISPALINNLDTDINGLLARYYLLQKEAEELGLKPYSY